MDLRFVYLTMDGGHNAALRQAARMLYDEHGIRLHLGLYSMAALQDDATWQRLETDIRRADFIFGCMIFGEEWVRPLERMFQETSAPILIITSNPALIHQTRLGGFSLAPVDEEEQGLFARWMGKLRPKKKKGRSEGHRQTTMLKNLMKLMKYVPGKMRGLHTFVSAHDFWLHSSPENLKRMMIQHIDRYVDRYDGKLPVEDALEYPDAAIYHPDAPAPFPDIASYRAWRRERGMPVAGDGNGAWKGSVGLLTMRAIILSGNTAHLDQLIRDIEAHGVEARMAYSALLDYRPAIAHFFTRANGQLPPVDLLINTMGFPLVGGPAGSNPADAVETLNDLDVGYLDMIPLSFQRIEDWRASDMGLTPIHVAMNVALPELDGVAEPVIFGGPTITGEKFLANKPELAIAGRRIARRVRLRHKANAEKKVAVVLFNFPPNLGNAGTAAFLDVFASLHRLLLEMKEQGYRVEIPEDPDELRRRVAEGNAVQRGTDGNVATQLTLEQYRELFPWHPEIEQYWGPAPGELLTDGKNFHILGDFFGNVFVGIQPSFGYERDPMRLLMGKGCSPHHGFAAFYAWLDHVYDADAVIHFGTHGALEFMPGKQVGVSAECWPPRLLGSLPSFYYYCVNNPSEGAIAKRRGASTLVSYMVPPLQQAGLYKGLRRLKDSVDQYRKAPDGELLTDIRTQAERLGIVVDAGAAPPVGSNGHANGHSNGHQPAAPDEAYIAALGHELLQVEQRMIPLGLHVVGRPPQGDELIDMLNLVATFNPVAHPERPEEKLPVFPAIIARGLGWDYEQLQKRMKEEPAAQAKWEEMEAIARQALALFVDAPRDPATQRADARAVEAYLREKAGVPAGLLANLWPFLDELIYNIRHDKELAGMIRGLAGGFVPPSPGNDVMRNVNIVPTGRNIHSLDPYRVPSAGAVLAAGDLVDQMLARLTRQQGKLPETVAMVLWGTDNLKSDGEGVAQCLALLGARAIEDELGNIADVILMPLEELGRPRIDIVMTLSGIFRDLFHHQTTLLDKAVRLAAEADEPIEMNYVRKHALEQAEELGISVNDAATRVFSNAPGVYGANVNHLVESSTWEKDDELSDMFMTRKSYAFHPRREWHGARDLMERSLATVDATFQNIDSFELGISDVDHYYEYLGGVAKSVEKLRGKRPPVLVADALSSTNDRLASLEQMVRLETRAKLLNPRWHESMLDHGYEGVREIELRVSNTYGWSATADAVEGWVYQDIAGTFLLDEEMRARMAAANPHATAAIARRLLEADNRGFWDADDEMIDRLREIYGDLEDQLEGIATPTP